MQSATSRRLWRSLPWLAALLLLWTASSVFAQAQADADPPGRVAALSWREGSLVFAPAGDEEWTELPANRPLTTGDRLWTDSASRAEVQLGAATLHLGEESHFGISALDDRGAQFILLQGTLNARVRELAQGENFEIDTPNLALRASQPGDYRVDVSDDGRRTRVVVQSGVVTVFGEGGDAIHLGAGQQATFAGRYLAQVQDPAFQGDAFSQWAGERNRAEDLSAAARHVPRGVVGYSQLDAHGTWGQDPTYGEVWYPQTTVADWAPYRYGQWTWVQPWGWTWVDDAPWGFAPFHYGRWAQIGSRWAWVPGRMVARPVYSPALVVFLGGGGSTRFTGWYPLGPGEAWWPAYRTSTRYVNHANFNINLSAYPRNYENHVYRHRANAVTAVRVEDFRPGRPVRDRWQPLPQGVIGQAQVGVAPPRPERRVRELPAPLQRLRAQPPAGAQLPLPSRFWGSRQQREVQRTEQVAPVQQAPQVRQVQPVQQVQPRLIQQQPQQAEPRFIRQQEQPRPPQWEQERAVREQALQRYQQERLQREADHQARQQQWEASRQRQQQDPVRQAQEAVQRQQPQPLVGRQPNAEPPRQHQKVAPPEAQQREGRGQPQQRDDNDERPGRARGWGRG
ncbi:FecR domain-containing protein [Ramlibacter sp. XY19]|uniref:DUF6600 domain-containing protein n=1 Tax=Ramlibacter paludis TaxID=2908000 RepID=UPI0023DBAAEC|nr:DUF6600 domain-containing protein [Ramlibacter paludis]MCG2594709.1 FecR domain-containing protein [Ramlibacter paludis]